MAAVRHRKHKEPPDTAIPRFTIDLSLDPSDRYVALAKRYRLKIQQLTSLFDSLLSDLGVPKGFHKTINRLARLVLRRVHSPIETAELLGISRTAEISLYLLVSLNLVLDLLMGCTSGAVRTLGEDRQPGDTRMLHFRTLDWGMDPLRSVIVQLDFIRSKSVTGTQVLGSSITYVGFVGVLTGVREKLSLSLNFRAVHNASTKGQQFQFYFHHLLVLLGFRQSISSMLRSCLFGNESDWAERPRKLQEITNMVPSKHTTAAYLIFCDGKRGVTMEKDFATAVIRESESFLVTTNHDLEQDTGQREGSSPAALGGALQELIEESENRRDCVVGKWKAKLRKERRRQQRATKNSAHGTLGQVVRTRSMRSGKQSFDSIETAQSIAEHIDVDTDSLEHNMSITTEELVRWTKAFPTTNEVTHFAAILDPSAGNVLWSERYTQPIEVSSDEAPYLSID